MPIQQMLLGITSASSSDGFVYSDFAYGDFLRGPQLAFDGSLSSRAEPHDNDAVYFDFSYVDPTGTLLNYDNNSRLPTYSNNGGLAASPSLRSKPINNAFDGVSTSYCDLTYLNGQFSRLTFEKPITNVTNITIGYDGEGDPGYNGGNHVTNVSFNGSRQTVQIYSGGAITLENLDFISQPGNGVCRLYDVTITTTTQSATELTIDGGVTASTSLEMYMTKAGSPGSADWTVNGAFLGGSVPTNAWINVGNLLGSYPLKLKNIALYHNSGSSSVELMAIKVDGTILTDAYQSNILGGTTLLLSCQSSSSASTHVAPSSGWTVSGSVVPDNDDPFNSGQGSLDFDGSGGNDYIQTTTNQMGGTLETGSFAIGLQDFTLECWIKTTTTGTDGFYRRIYLHDGTQNNYQGHLQIAVTPDAGGAKLNAWDTGTLDLVSTTVISTGSWVHVAVVRKDGVVTQYVNGTAEGSQTWNVSVTGQQPRIGSQNGSGGWEGLISNLRLVRGKAIYTSNFSVPSNPLTSYP